LPFLVRFLATQKMNALAAATHQNKRFIPNLEKKTKKL